MQFFLGEALGRQDYAVTLKSSAEEALEAQAPAATIEAMRRYPIHAWRYGPDREITFADPATGTTFELHPRTQAWVQRISDDQYLELMLQAHPEESAP